MSDVPSVGVEDSRSEPAELVRDPPVRLLPGDPVNTAPAAGWSLPDRRHEVIDEIATAERAVQDELWFPTTRPRRKLWLDLTIVVDSCPSMPLWRAQVDEFVELLEQFGSFRMVHRRHLDTNRSLDGIAQLPVLRDMRRGTGPRDSAEMGDGSSRRAVRSLPTAWATGGAKIWFAPFSRNGVK